MRITLHVGLPKTGTTSFQDYMLRHHAEPGAVVWYPGVGTTPRDPSHAWLGEALRAGDIEALETRLRALEGHSGHVVLSDENLYVEMPGVTDAVADAVTGLLADHDVTLLCVTREAAHWRRSFYLQSVEMRRSRAHFDHPTAKDMWQTPLKMEEFFEQPYAQAVQDYPRQRDRIAQMVGAQAVVELPYEDAPDVVELMVRALGLPWDGAQDARRNPSLSDVQGEVLRQANAQRQVDGRMIRTLIMRDNGVEVAAKKLARISEWAPTYDWGQFAFMSNPPLEYSEAEFEALVSRLRQDAETLCAQAEQAGER
ncbi:hypothetical protein SAMN04490248_101275 [Salinihabitans flavidus]|uniref:Sulfotransferase family protein n=1 Tax=Salinihabitans flavidus TaxID=569882 RepID=A0A1H8LT98_9RHOB|nr:hypothetical protein [Salinihabitans flavidus]SEO08088.1 hypothetical protein SAMN04490248_101275 [Salinihabitans flavidus]